MKHEQRDEYKRVRQLFDMVTKTNNASCVKSKLFEPFKLNNPAGTGFVIMITA